MPNELFSPVSIVRTFSGHTVGKVRKAECGMKRYLYLAAGTFLMAAAYKSIYQSVGMVTGGFSGIGVIVNRVTGGVWAGGVPLWITNVTLNVPLFIAAFYIEGKEFIKNTVTGAVLLTLYLAVLPAVPVDAADYLLAAVYGRGSLRSRYRTGVKIRIYNRRNGYAGGIAAPVFPPVCTGKYYSGAGHGGYYCWCAGIRNECQSVCHYCRLCHGAGDRYGAGRHEAGKGSVDYFR